MVKNSATSVGTLYIVATPIGNREDISLRALETLRSVDTILAEDTRHSMQLLNSLGIQKPLLSLHTHNEGTKSERIIEALKEGKSFALIRSEEHTSELQSLMRISYAVFCLKNKKKKKQTK